MSIRNLEKIADPRTLPWSARPTDRPRWAQSWCAMCGGRVSGGC